MNRKILIVEDEEDIRFVLSKLLVLPGCQTYFASNGIEALLKMQNDTFDLIITDLVMPRMNGIEFVKKVLVQRGVKVKPHLFIMSGALDEESIDKFSELGKVKFFSKPIDFKALVSEIESRLK